MVIKQMSSFKESTDQLFSLFVKLDTLRESVHFTKLNSYQNLNKKIISHSNDLNDLIKFELNVKRNSLIESIKSQLKNELADLSLNKGLEIYCSNNDECANSKLYFPRLKFIQSKKAINETQLLIGELNYGRSGFSLTKKLKNMRFLNQFEEITLNSQEEIFNSLNAKVLLLDKRKIFFYLKIEDNFSSLRVCSRNRLNLLATKNINEQSNYIYRNIMTWGDRIVALFRKPNDKLKNELSIYDDNLSLTCKSLCFEGNDVNLCSLSDNEIFCWFNEAKTCNIYSMNNLDLLKCFGQKSNVLDPFYFSNGILIDVRFDLILFYFYDSEYLKQSIKIFNIQDGNEISHLNLKWDYFSKMFKIDLEKNIIVKFYEPNNLVKVFHAHNGSLINEFICDDFLKFNRIDLTRNDEVICFDKARNSIFIF